MIPLIGRDYETHLVASIRDAKHSIDVAMYDWRWYLDQPLYPVQPINRALVEAVRRGVIVRDMKAWGLDTFIRVTIGTHRENVKFIRALKEVLK